MNWYKQRLNLPKYTYSVISDEFFKQEAIYIKKVIAVIFVTAAVISGAFALSDLPQPAASYSAAQVKQTDITSKLMCRGVIAEVSNEYIFTDISCKTLEVYVRPGDIVTAGERLFLVESLTPAAMDDVAVFSALDSAYNHYDSGIDQDYAQDILAAILSSRSTQFSGAQVERKLINAPVGGVVSKVFSAKNFYASPALPLAEILDVSSLIVKAEIPEAYASLIQPGQKAQITGDGFPGVVLNGTVTSIMPFATQKGNIISQGETVIEAIISIDGVYENHDIKPGLNANIWVISDHRENALTIPYEAIYADENGREFVYKLDGGYIIKSAIVTGYELETSVEAVSGVEADDMIILYPDPSIENGKKLSLVRENNG